MCVRLSASEIIGMKQMQGKKINILPGSRTHQYFPECISFDFKWLECKQRSLREVGGKTLCSRDTMVMNGARHPESVMPDQEFKD